MQVRILIAASAAAMAASAIPSFAQETVRDGLVMVNVEGVMTEVPVTIAAQACGMHAADVIAAAGMANTDAKGADMVAPAPEAAGSDMAGADAAGTEEAATGTDMAAAESGAAADAGTAEAEPTTEAAVGAGAGTTETGEGEVAEATTPPDVGLTPETATGGDQPATTADAGTDAAGSDVIANAELTASGEMGAATAVCEIDQATADQYGIEPASGG